MSDNVYTALILVCGAVLILALATGDHWCPRFWRTWYRLTGRR